MISSTTDMDAIRRKAQAEAEAMTAEERRELIAQWQEVEHKKQQRILEAIMHDQEIATVADILCQAALGDGFPDHPGAVDTAR
jgi:hypothetical protein